MSYWCHNASSHINISIFFQELQLHFHLFNPLFRGLKSIPGIARWAVFTSQLCIKNHQNHQRVERRQNSQAPGDDFHLRLSEQVPRPSCPIHPHKSAKIHENPTIPQAPGQKRNSCVAMCSQGALKQLGKLVGEDCPSFHHLAACRVKRTPGWRCWFCHLSVVQPEFSFSKFYYILNMS